MTPPGRASDARDDRLRPRRARLRRRPGGRRAARPAPCRRRAGRRPGRDARAVRRLRPGARGLRGAHRRPPRRRGRHAAGVRQAHGRVAGLPRGRGAVPGVAAARRAQPRARPPPPRPARVVRGRARPRGAVRRRAARVHGVAARGARRAAAGPARRAPAAPPRRALARRDRGAPRPVGALGPLPAQPRALGRARRPARPRRRAGDPPAARRRGLAGRPPADRRLARVPFAPHRRPGRFPRTTRPRGAHRATEDRPPPARRGTARGRRRACARRARAACLRRARAPARAADRYEGPRTRGERHRADVRRLEGRADARGRALRRQGRRRGGAVHRRHVRRLCRQPRPLPGGHPRQRRPRPPGHEPGRDGELPLGAGRQRMDRAREARADLRHPPDQRRHVPLGGPRPQRADEHRRAGRQHRDADARRAERVPLPEGAGADRQPVGRRRRVRLPGDAGGAGRPGGVPDAARRPERLGVPGPLHPRRRSRGDGDDRRQQREPAARRAAAPRHAELGHARRLPRLSAQLLRDAGRRRLPARRPLGHDAQALARGRADRGPRRDAVRPRHRAGPVHRRRRRGHHPTARGDPTPKRSLVAGPPAPPDETQCAPGPGQDQFIAGGGVVIPPPPAPAAAGLPPCRPIRMTAADVTRLLTWQTTRGIKLDMVFNGAGSDEFKEDTGLANDPLADAFVANKDAFRWINHTFTHLNLDLLSAADLSAEIGNNIAWGIAHGLPMDPHELVTGEHSGLHNPNMAGTLNALGVTWVAADNSREPVQYTIGGATTVPRYPSNVYYNVETQVEQLDEYNFIYLPPAAGGKCVNSSTNTCRGTPATWAEYVDSEASIMFRHLMGNDPRPHFAHQSNLTADGVLYTVVDEVLNRYRRYFAPELVQLSHTDIGRAMRQQTVWAQDLAAGRVSAFLQDGQVHVTTTTTMDVPVTGTPQGTLYGGERSGWFTVTAGQPLVAQAPPDAAPVTRPGAPTTPAATPPAAPGATPPAAPGATPPAAPGATPPAAPGATPPAAPGTKPPGANPPNRPGATPPRDADRPAAGTNGDRPGATSPANRSALRMTRLRMTPRRFAASHRRNVARRRRGHATDGTTITWLMSRPATVRLTVQLIRPGGRTSTVTSFTRKAITGENTVRFSGRIGRRTLRPGRYRMVVRATSADGARTAAQRLTFTVVRG